MCARPRCGGPAVCRSQVPLAVLDSPVGSLDRNATLNVPAAHFPDDLGQTRELHGRVPRPSCLGQDFATRRLNARTRVPKWPSNQVVEGKGFDLALVISQRVLPLMTIQNRPNSVKSGHHWSPETGRQLCDDDQDGARQGREARTEAAAAAHQAPSRPRAGHRVGLAHGSPGRRPVHG